MSDCPWSLVRHSTMIFALKQVRGNEVRVPDPILGEATVISRYGKERAILIHPADFDRGCPACRGTLAAVLPV